MFSIFVVCNELHQLVEWSRGSNCMDAYFCSPHFPEVVWKNWRGFRCWWYYFGQSSEQLQHLQFQWEQKACSVNIKLAGRPQWFPGDSLRFCWHFLYIYCLCLHVVSCQKPKVQLETWQRPSCIWFLLV